MLVTGLMFVAVTAVVKHVGDDVPAAQAAFLRYVLGLVFLIPMIKPILAAHLTGRQKKLFWARGLVHRRGDGDELPLANLCLARGGAFPR